MLGTGRGQRDEGGNHFSVDADRGAYVVTNNVIDSVSMLKL